MIAGTTSTIEVSGRQYPCYCKVPVTELVALPEREHTKAWYHILQHTTKEAPAQ